MVEFALVAPLIFFLIFGLIEMGFASLDYLTLANATRTGARLLSASQDNATADLQTLLAIEKAISVINTKNIDQVIIFNATDDGKARTVDNAPASACIATDFSATSSAQGSNDGSGYHQCNVYIPLRDFGAGGIDSATPSRYVCNALTPPGSTYASYWCPTSRVVKIADGLSDVGVWVEVDHHWITGFFGTDVKMHNNTVMRIEPRNS